MSEIAIVYFSGTGHTHLIAEAIGKGASKVEGANVELLRITGDRIVEGRWQDEAMMAKLQAADAIVFG
jgi:NAD(P)H dehydrogenase (quinone)